MGNTLGISRVYLKHFVKCIDSRWVLVQGGRRSGKSFAVYKWLVFLASGKPKTTMVVAATFPALQLAISDFQRATGLVVQGNAVFGYSVTMGNGSRFLFRSFDVPEKAQGTSCDTLYLEETLNIPEQVVKVLAMSVTGQIYCCYNPSRKSYLDDYVKPDGSNRIVTTFKDNPWLTDEQREEFETMKRRALSPSAGILDIYNYRVYYCGEFSSMSGRVFKQVFNCTDEEYTKVPAVEVFSLDFGFTASEQSDATALVGVKIHEGKLYAKEYLYGTDLTDNKTLALRMAKIGLDENSYIFADTGGLGRTRLRALITADDYSWTEPEIRNGFNICAVVKGKILDGLNQLNQYEIYVTDTSCNLRREMDNYELTNEGKPKSGCADHALDCVRYSCVSYRRCAEY